MLKYIITLVLLVGVLEASSQRIVVMSFRRILYEKKSPLVLPTTEKDVKGCAIIKVINAKPGLDFDFGVKGHAIATKEDGRTFWFWVPNGVTTATIYQKQLGVLRNYQFGIDLEDGEAYEMVLSKDKEDAQTQNQIETQWIMISSFPQFAEVSIDDYPAGKTPFYGSLSLGIHKLILKENGETIEKSISVSNKKWIPIFNYEFEFWRKKITKLHSEANIMIDLESSAEYTGGGLEVVDKYFKKEMNYPLQAIDYKIEGTVKVRTIISETGKTSHVKLVSGIGGGCDEEALRLVKTMPKWIPAYKCNSSVPSEFELEVNFELPKK